MSFLDPQEAFAHFRDRTLEGIQSHFPVKGRLQTLQLEKLEVKDDLDPDDLRAQHKAKIEGGSFVVPVYGHMKLVDNLSGRTVDSRKVRLAEIPKMTQRYSYILDGQEYQVDNQWQLKPGAYTRRRLNGELETRFNVVQKTPFDMVLDPATKQLHIQYNKTKLAAYPLMKVMGVSDDEIERTLGKDVLAANKNARGVAGTVEKFYKSDRKENAPSKEHAERHLYETFMSAKMKPEATALTLGKPIDHVSGEALLLGAQKLLKVQSGHPEDDRDSLLFKELRSIGDFTHDKLRNASRAVALKALRKIDKSSNIHDIIKFDTLNEPIKQAFHKNSAARVAVQINPVEMVSSALQTTIMGPGGIQSEQSVMDEAKFVNPSHFGFLDPIHTPEGSKTGVTLRLPIGVKKVGNTPKIPLYNLKTKSTELVAPGDFLNQNVVLPDQVRWENGHPVPFSSTVKLAGKNNEMVEGKFSDAQYVMRHPSQLFNMTSNLIPFMGNSSGGRASMATRHIEQSISLINREAPLVQVGTGVDKGMTSFEKLLGFQASHPSPVDGVVKSVSHDRIVVHGKSGEKEVQLYHNYPLNDAKSVFHSTPLVKVGDKVHAGQTLADTNFSKNGTLALGTNLRVAYIPFKGYNFEDGVVISESAAKNKLSSVHLYKHNLPVDDATILDRHKFEIQHSGLFKADQLKHIGSDGLPKVGAKVQPGDPLILALKPMDLKDRTGAAAIRKSVAGVHTDKSLRWDGEGEGEIVGVTRGKNGIQVHVRAVEPMQVGDKLAGRYGNKGIVTMILPDHEMPKTKDGAHIEVALNPSGVPGRMNVGQVLETAASKIAEKLGKPYIAPVFPKDVDMVDHVQKELKHHGLSDTEELFDPVTHQSLGHALVGKQHILKLVHQVDKKVAVASGMGLPGQPATDKYDINLQPKTGQRIGSLGMYALLAHGAKANLREMQTWKGEGPDAQTNEAKKWPSQHNQVWRAIQTGEAMPTPKPTFAFKKFEDLLRGSGVNIEKKGHEYVLMPLTDKHVLELAGDRSLPKAGERLDAKVDKATGELKTRPGGLFDDKLTGGHGGTKWSRIDLAEPTPNPVFEAPICALTGLKKKDFYSVVMGEKGVLPNGQLAELGSGTVTGGRAIEQMLKQIDVKKALGKAQQELSKAKPADIDNALKKVKYLSALDQLEMKPHEAYVLRHLPVIPPSMRPASLMQDGNIKYADINQLYSSFAQINQQLKDPKIEKNFTEGRKADLRRNLYDGLKSITGFGIPYAQAKYKGLLHTLSGASPKQGYFQNVLVQKRQDLTMRSTIVPEPALGLDEVGLPRDHALHLFRPFVVKKLQDMGAAPTPLDAQKLLTKKDNPTVLRALDKVLEERPILLKRDPALHKYSVQGFTAKAVDGNAIKIHPLVCGGFNADFDGNCYTGDVDIVVRVPYVGHTETMMKFGPNTKVIARDDVGVVHQVALDSFPKIEGTQVKDKNGADVFQTLPGLQVLSYHHGDHSPVFSAVTHLTIEERCDVTRVRTRRFDITASTNESLCVYNSSTEEVEDCCPKDAIGKLCPVTKKLPSSSQFGDQDDFEVGWVIGSFVSDGSVYPNYISYSKTSIVHRDRMYWGLCQMQGTNVPRLTYEDHHDGSQGVSGQSVKEHFTLQPSLISLFEGCFVEASEEYEGKRKSLRKRLPPDFTTYNQSMQLGLLAGLLDGDGSVSVSSRGQLFVQFSTSSVRLVEDIKLLGQCLGVRVSVTASEPKEGRLQKHTNYVLNLSVPDVRTLPSGVRLLSSEKKADALNKLFGCVEVRDDQDIVPVPLKLLELATKSSGPMGGTALLRTLATVKSTRKATPYVTRKLAKEMLSIFEKANIEGLESWKHLVHAVDVQWDVVIEQTPIGKETVYDLVVPETKVFVVNGGLVVWDTMSVFVPISREAVQEAHRMKPTQNLFAESSGKIAYAPTLESALGLYKLSLVGKDSGKTFSNVGQVLDAVREKKIGHEDVVQVGGKKTTAGRVLLSTALPEPMRNDVLHNLDKQIDKGGLTDLLTKLGKNHKDEFDKSVNRLKDIGNGAAFGSVLLPMSTAPIHNITDPKKNIFIPIGTHSLSLNDFKADKEVRSKVLSEADAEVHRIKSLTLPESVKNSRIVDVYTKADHEMKELHEKKLNDKPTNLFTMYKAGVKPGWDQYKQMVIAPMLLKDSADRIIPTPVTKSYAEGLDVSGYWTQMHGARRGTVLKVQEVQDPGYMSKLLMNNTMHLVVGDHDCGTSRGLTMHVDEKDVHDRVLAQDFKSGKVFVKAGTVLSPDITSQIKAVDKNARLLVRSPLKCEHEKGICQKCLGVGSHGDFHSLGTNAGIHAAHTVGERAVQLTLKSFHTGGVVEQQGGKLLNAFARFEQLTLLPKKIPNAASLSMKSGTIDKIEHTGTGVDVYIGGHKHFVGKDASGNALHQPTGKSPWSGLKVGMRVEAGDPLSDPTRTYVNPHDLYKATGSIDKVQNEMASEMYNLYKDENIKRRHVETIVKAMSNLTKVVHPGDASGILHGEFHPLSVVQKLNSDLVKQGRTPVEHTPVLKGVIMLPMSLHNDWMAKLQHQRLRDTIAGAAATAGRADVHGTHPIPGLAVGSEFGLNKDKSTLPGYGHLRDVPSHHY